MFLVITLNGNRFGVDTVLKTIVRYNNKGQYSAIRFDEVINKKIHCILDYDNIYKTELENHLEDYQRILKLINIL